MEIIKKLVPKEKYNIKCPYTMEPEFIVCHNTANKASARNEIAYMISNNNEVSFHYAIDDKEIVQGIPEDRNAWHASDGANGDGNRKGIAIEICYSYCQKEVNGKWVEDKETWNAQYKNKFIAAEKLAAQFIASKLKEKGWGIEKVKKHQDFGNHKYCPHRTLDMGWQRFLDMIKSYMNESSVSSKPVSSTSASNSNALYCVQVGAYKNKVNAEAQVAKLKKAGFDACITIQKNSSATIVVDELKVGDKVRLKSDAYIYGTKTKFASFIYNSTLYVRQIEGNKIIISTQKTGAITGAVNKNDLTKI